MALVAGWDATLSLGTTPTAVESVGKAINFRKTYTALNRTVFGSEAQVRSGGVYGVNFTFQGLVDSTVYAAIEGLMDGGAEAFSLEIGDGGTAGTWAGNCIITELTAEADVEGDWTFTVTCESTGAVTYT